MMEEFSREFDLRLSSAFLQDAINGRNVHFVQRPQELKLYERYKGQILTWALYIVYVIYLALALFERPSNRLMPFWATVSIEFVCIAFFVVRFFHSMLFVDAKTFWADTKHRTLAGILTLVVIDIVLYTILTEAGVDKGHVPRWSRPLRPFLIVNFQECRQVRQGFRNIRRTLPEVVNVFLLFLANTALFALMAFKLKGYFASEDFFGSYAKSLWSMYVLVTTANHPNVMMPAIEANGLVPAIFFVVYLVVNLYMFMSVFLAVVYNRFRCNLKQEVKEALERKEHLINEAFEKAKTEGGFVKKEDFQKVMKLAFPRREFDYGDAVWNVLDPNETGKVDKETFTELPQVLLLPYTDIRDKGTLLEKQIPGCYNSKPSKAVVSVVKHKRFRHIFDLVILVNALFIGLDLDGGEVYFLSLFSLEIILKLYAFGFMAFFRKAWTVFDTVVVGSALITSFIEWGSSTSALDFLMVLRVVRIFKVFHAFPRFKNVLNTLLHILPSMATYGAVLFIIMYAFAVIGMELFNGRIFRDKPNCGNVLLENSAFVDNGYCPNNFNDLKSAFLVLFEALVVNQWHVLAEGHAKVTTEWAKLYFVAFHVVCVILILNIFTAFVLEVFILEYTLSKTKIKSTLAEKIAKMGLAASKPKKTKEDPKPNEVINWELFNFEDEELDADHEAPFDHTETELDGNGNNMEENVKDFSGETTIRFVLSHKTRSVQHLLEKMFEKEVT